MEVSIKKNHFSYGGTKYFRKAAESLNLGSYGNKVKNIFVANGLIHDDTVKGVLPVKAVTSFSLSTASTATNSFGVDGKFVTAKVNGQGGINVNWTKEELRDLSLIKIDITSEKQLRDNSNADTNCFRQLRDHNNGRICDQIFVIVSSNLIQNASFSAGIDANISVSNSKFTLNLAGATANTSSLTLEVSAGSVFAYALRKPDFDKLIKKNAKKIDQLTRDEWGVN
jgi:hypothetical protein